MLAYPINPDLTPGEPVELTDGVPVPATEMTLSVPPAVPEGVGVYYDRATRQWVVSSEPLVEEPTDYGTIVTVLAFRQRFTMAEKQAIELGSLDDPAAAMESRALAAALRAFLGDLNVATFIDLQRADTMASVQQLEAQGLIAEGRADEILRAPVVWSELPQDRQLAQGG